MKNIIDKNKFEKFLLTNWSQFIDAPRLLAYILGIVRDSDLSAANTSLTVKIDSPKLTISKFTLTGDIFCVWVDFMIPKDKDIAIGSCELKVDIMNETITLIQITGSILGNSTEKINTKNQESGAV